MWVPSCCAQTLHVEQASTSTCTGAVVGVELEAKKAHAFCSQSAVAVVVWKLDLGVFFLCVFFAIKTSCLPACYLQVIYSSFGKVGNPQMKVVGARISHQSGAKRPVSLFTSPREFLVLPRQGELAYTLTDATKKYVTEGYQLDFIAIASKIGGLDQAILPIHIHGMGSWCGTAGSILYVFLWALYDSL